MEESIKSERRVNFTDANQFINNTKSISSDERDNLSIMDDSVLSICPQCNFSTVSIQSLDIHMEQEHGDNSGLVTESEKLQNTFNMVISDEKNTEDNVDKRGEYFNNSTLDNQTKSECSSVNSSSIVAGKQISDSRRRYRCNICPVTFPWHGDLAAHLSEVHGFQKASRDGGKTRAGSYKCSFCMYVAKYQSELKRHRRLHMGVKPFGCVFCKYRSAWKGDLKRHIESHHRGHFNSEEELAAIMAQYKNNAGTDIKGTTEDENHQESLSNNAKDEFNDTAVNLSEHQQFIEPNETFSCEKCNFVTTNKEKISEHNCQCPVINFQIFDNQKNSVPTFSTPFEMGLNLTVPIQNSSDFSNSLNANRTFHHVTSNNFPSLNSISDSILNIPQNINHHSEIANAQLLPSYMQSLNNDLLSAMVSQNNMSFNDIVSRMFTRMNGIIPAPPPSMSTKSMLHDSLPTKQENIFANNTPILSKSVKPTSITNYGILNHQTPMASLQTSGIDFSKSNTDYEFPSPKKIESDKGFKSINGMLTCPRPISADIKPKDNSLGLLITQQEHWKRFKCSACGHRSNWKWDINKHIKVAHPERDGIATIELSYEEAKTTLQNYLNSTKANKARSHNSFESEEGYYRPYKCSACGHRSNWKWDVNKHIKQVHQRQAEVITLSMEEAKNTICQYKRRRRAPGLTNFSENLSHTVTSTPTGSVVADKSNISSPLENNSSVDNSYSEKEKNEPTWHEVSPATTTSQQQNPRIDMLRLKRLKCDCCGYRSNYRSDISRHIRRKHDNMASVVFLSDIVTNESLIDQPFTIKMELTDSIDGDSVLKQMSIIDNGQTGNQRKLWQCNLCQFSHKEKIQVSHHITRNHDPERPFNCKLCHYGTDYRNSLLRHVKAKHKISSINEVMNQNLSKVRFVPNSDAVSKIEQNGELLKIDSTQCSKCSAIFATNQDLFQHTVTNHSASDEEMYLIFKPWSGDDTNVVSVNFFCQYCPFYSNNADAAQIHQFQHSDICHYLFRCPHCTYKASHNKFLLNHITLHLNGTLFYQTDQPEDLSCPKMTGTTIQNPMLVNVPKVQSLPKIITKKVHCNKCSLRFSNICHLRLHLQRIHYKKFPKRNTNQNIFKINNSNLLLMDENMLAYRNISYENNRYWCDECGFLTNDDGELKMHLSKHLSNNNNGVNKCTLCTYHPDSKADLKNHELLHVLFEVSNFKDQFNDKYNNLKCDKCNFTTNINEKLVFHQHFHYMSSSHHGFSCPKCSFKHIQLYGLIKHLKYHH